MKKHILILFILTLFGFKTSLSAQGCECTNCPVGIADNGSFQGFLDVTLSGPNDLAQCGLQQVCFTINHTWIGDLALTLTSPGGVNYLVMADSNNGSGGCGTNADNVNICVTTGVGNPITNNTAYTCNAGPACLNGNWTMPCGGVTDPITGAIQAPGCDLAAFNLPGQPSNGTWTLTINDICGADVGQLIDWSLEFDCPTASCDPCVAEGGALFQPDVQGCIGSSDLNLNINPVYSGGNNAPTPAFEYSYTYLVSQNGVIVSPVNIDGPNLSSLPPGDYQICGLSYLTAAPPIFGTLGGTSIATLGLNLSSPSPPFCGDISDDCFNVSVGLPNPPITVNQDVCLGESITLPNGSLCFSPGVCDYFEDLGTGCPQQTTYILNPLLITTETINATVCQGQCYTYDGVDYCDPVQVITGTNADGCAHIITLNLTFTSVEALIAPPAQLSCTTTSVTLDGSTSTGDTFQWTDAAGNILGTNNTLDVNTLGCYTITVSNTSATPACVDQETVCVTEDGGGQPVAPTIFGDTPICAPASGNYSVVNDPTVAYLWTVSGNGSINGGQGTDNLTVDWTAAGPAQVCITATNTCGTSLPNCFNVIIDAVPDMPTIIGDNPICPNEQGVYTVDFDPDVINYVWTVPTDANIISGQGNNSISVTFGTNAGDVCVSAINTCGSSTENCFPVSLFDLPADADISGAETVCPGETVTYSTPVDINTTDYSWVVPACANIDSGQGTPAIVVTWDANCTAAGDICLNISNDCGSGLGACFPVTIGNSPPSPVVSGESIVCLGDSENYTIPPVVGALDIIWTITGGSIDSGQGTEEVSVTWLGIGAQEVCASVITDCGTSNPDCFAVEVLDIPAVPVIGGDTPLCVDQIGDYEITSPFDPSDTFSWSVTGSGTFQGGNTSSSVQIEWAIEGTYDVCVTISNSCGDNQACFPVVINPSTVLPMIGGPSSVCQNSIENYFVTTPVVGETYDWTVPAGATITPGPTTDQISIDWGTSLGGDVCVTATGICGAVAPVCLTVNTDGVPALGGIVGDNSICSGAQGNYSIGDLSTATSYTWSVDCGTILSGQNTTDILFEADINCLMIELCVTADTDCGLTSPSCINISIENVPPPTNQITGIETSCTSATETYCADIVNEANTYTWVVNGGTIISGQGTDCIDVEWTTAGIGNICVTPINDCGSGLETCLDVMVDEVTAMPLVLTDIEVCACDQTTASVDATDATDIAWTVPNGATIISGQGTDNISIDWCNAESGDICVLLTYACGSANGCTPVAFSEIPVSDAGQDDAICGLTYTLNAVPTIGTGSWTAVGVGISDFLNINDPATSVTVSDFGDYIFTWTEDNNTCIDSDEVVISFNESPATVGSIVSTCNGTNTAYTISFTVSGGNAPYSLTPVLAGNWNVDTFTSNEITSGDSYTFTINDANNCQSQEYVGQFTCDCTTDAGTIVVESLNACADGTVQATHNGDQILDDDDVSQFIISDGDPINGQIFDMNNTGEFGLIAPMQLETIYYIAFAVGDNDGNGNVNLSAPCATFTEGAPVIFHAYPNPNAGMDDAICGLEYNLSATPEFLGGVWEQIGGNGIAMFDDMNNTNSTVSVSEFGTYSFTWTEDNNGCVGNDVVEITFNDAPSLDGVQVEVCDLATGEYTVSFSIMGGQAPYFVDGIMVTGNNFVSTSVGSNVPYNFEITDSNGCGPTMVTGVRNCDCQTDAGTMDQELQEVCVDGIASGLPDGDEIIDPNNDAIQYVIHDGNGTTLGTVFDINNTPDFSLVAPMEVDITYYISTIIGADLGGGIVDINDPCFRIAVGTPVIFRPLPSGLIIEDAMICEGGNADIDFTLVGTAPFTIEFDGQILTDQTNAFSLPVSPLTTTTYSLTQVTDALGCTASLNSSVTITVNTPPTATLSMNGSVCNSTDNGNSTTLNFADFIEAGDTSGSWEDMNNSGATGDFGNYNFNDVATGDYTFAYTTGNAIAPCQNVTYTIEVTVEDCMCPSVETSAPAPLCNDGGTLDLSFLEVTNQTGTWAIFNQPLGSNATLDGNTFDVTGVLAGEYVFEFTLTNTPPDGCPTTSQETLTVNQAVNAGTPNSVLSFCQNEAQGNISLFDELVGADDNGTWSEISSNSSSGGAFNSNTGIFNPTGQAAGTYTFQYLVNATAPCSDAISTISVIVDPAPIADAGETQTITCIELEANLGGNSSAGTGISYMWEASNGGILEESQLTESNPTVLMAGNYGLVVTNEFGCTASDEVTIQAANDLPNPEFNLSPISCFGESDGVISVDTVTGGQAPYVYSMDGENYNTTSFFPGLSGGVYTIYIQDANGCTNAVQFDIPEPNEMSVELFAFIEGGNTIVFGDSVQLGFQASISSDSLDLIQWTPSDILSCDTCVNVTATPVETTNFSLTVSANGCAASNNLTVVVDKNIPVFIPNAFSPNGDGANDEFLIFADRNVVHIKSFFVFNRWGEVVYQYFDFPPNDPTLGWDGTHRGEAMNSAVFTWYAELELIDGREEVIKGDVTLMR